MCAIPARVAGVDAGRARLAAGPDGRVHPLVLAAAALCGVEEIYAMGGAQAIFALAYGTETIDPGRRDRRAGERLGAGGQARRLRPGRDRLPRRALGADADRRSRHRSGVGGARPLRPGRARTGEPAGGRSRSRSRCWRRSLRRPSSAAATRPSVTDAPLALVQVPDVEAAIELANAYAPEHLELLETDAAMLADRVMPPPAASSSAATARPPSATTSPAPTTCCRPAAPVASPVRSVPAPSGAGSPTSRSTAPRASWRRT